MFVRNTKILNMVNHSTTSHMFCNSFGHWSLVIKSKINEMPRLRSFIIQLWNVLTGVQHIFVRIIFLFLFPIDIGTFASFLQRKHDEYWIHYWIQTKIFNKYVMYFFRLYYHSTNPLQGDFYSPLPMSRKEKKKIMQRQASSEIFSANWHQIRNNTAFWNNHVLHGCCRPNFQECFY